MFAQAFYDHFGAQRPFYQLAHDLVFKLPGARALLQRYGTVPASPKNMARALERDAALLVYPGGDHETFRPSWESEEVDFAERTGFIKLALKHDVSIVPRAVDRKAAGPSCGRQSEEDQADQEEQLTAHRGGSLSPPPGRCA